MNNSTKTSMLNKINNYNRIYKLKMKKKTRIKRRRKSTNTHTVDLVRAPNHMAKKRRKTNPKHAAPPDIIIKKKV